MLLFLHLSLFFLLVSGIEFTSICEITFGLGQYLVCIGQNSVRAEKQLCFEADVWRRCSMVDSSARVCSDQMHR